MGLSEKVGEYGLGSILGDLSRGAVSLASHPFAYALAISGGGDNKSLKGDGRPVIVTPGFLTHDLFTYPLRRFLSFLGYEVYGWGNGFNMGDIERDVEYSKELLHNVYEKHDHRPVTEIGVSLGGLYAFEASRENESMVDRILTLASPISLPVDEDCDVPIVRLFKWWTGRKSSLGDELNERFQEIYKVPHTFFYTDSDGFLHSDWCSLKNSLPEEKIKIGWSHSGMMHNPLVLERVALELQRDYSNRLVH